MSGTHMSPRLNCRRFARLQTLLNNKGNNEIFRNKIRVCCDVVSTARSNQRRVPSGLADIMSLWRIDSMPCVSFDLAY